MAIDDRWESQRHLRPEKGREYEIRPCQGECEDQASESQIYGELADKSTLTSFQFPDLGPRGQVIHLKDYQYIIFLIPLVSSNLRS